MFKQLIHYKIIIEDYASFIDFFQMEIQFFLI